MPKIPVLKPKQVINVLERIGFVKERSKGSHIQFFKENVRVTVSTHNKDVRRGTLLNIIRQANLTVEEFINLLK